MKYRNTKTGAVIDIRSRLTGANWEPVEDVKPAAEEKPAKKPAKKRTVKK